MPGGGAGRHARHQAELAAHQRARVLRARRRADDAGDVRGRRRRLHRQGQHGDDDHRVDSRRRRRLAHAPRRLTGSAGRGQAGELCLGLGGIALELVEQLLEPGAAGGPARALDLPAGRDDLDRSEVGRAAAERVQAERHRVGVAGGDRGAQGHQRAAECRARTTPAACAGGRSLPRERARAADRRSPGSSTLDVATRYQRAARHPRFRGCDWRKSRIFARRWRADAADMWKIALIAATSAEA